MASLTSFLVPTFNRHTKMEVKHTTSLLEAFHISYTSFKPLDSSLVACLSSNGPWPLGSPCLAVSFKGEPIATLLLNMIRLLKLAETSCILPLWQLPGSCYFPQGLIKWHCLGLSLSPKGLHLSQVFYYETNAVNFSFLLRFSCEFSFITMFKLFCLM